MLNSNFKPQRLSPLTDNAQLLKVLVFEMANHFFALPISVIFKVINCPSVTDSADSSLGIADFEGQTVTVINLAQKLSPQNSATESLPKRFLILTQTRQGELCGIPINKPPALLEIPVDNIRPLPLSVRQINSLSIATHVATVPKSEGFLKVFLLGMAK